MLLFTILSLIVFVAMLVHCYICKGDFDCISDIAYEKHGWLFPTCMSIIAFCLLLPMLDKTPDAWRFICMITAGAFAGVGFTPHRDSTLMHHTHVACAVIAMLGVTSLWVIQGLWWMPIMFFLAGLRQRMTMGLEMGMMASAFAYALL